MSNIQLKFTQKIKGIRYFNNARVYVLLEYWPKNLVYIYMCYIYIYLCNCKLYIYSFLEKKKIKEIYKLTKFKHSYLQIFMSSN